MRPKGCQHCPVSTRKGVHAFLKVTQPTGGNQKHPLPLHSRLALQAGTYQKYPEGCESFNCPRSSERWAQMSPEMFSWQPLLPLWNHRPLSYIAIKDDFPSITLTKIKGTQMDKSHILSHSHTNPTSPHQFTPHSVGWQNPTQPQTSLCKQWVHRYHNCEINKKVQLSKLSHQKENR